MKRFRNFVAAATSALVAIGAGSAATAGPPQGGTITVEQAAAGVPAVGVAPAYIDAVSGALSAKGFTILADPGHSAYVAELSIGSTDVGTGSAKLPRERETIVPGASGGVGGGIVIPLSGQRSRSVPLRRFTLELRIRKRGQEVIVWRGAAVTVRAAGTGQGADEAIAASLSNAILAGYPVEPQGVVGVP